MLNSDFTNVIDIALFKPRLSVVTEAHKQALKKQNKSLSLLHLSITYCIRSITAGSELNVTEKYKNYGV